MTYDADVLAEIRLEGVVKDYDERPYRAASDYCPRIGDSGEGRGVFGLYALVV